MRLKFAACVISAAMVMSVLLPVTSFAYYDASEDMSARVVVVSGRSEKKVTPDFARISYEIVSEDEDSEQCQKKNDDLVRKLVNNLLDKGIEESSIKTSFSLTPKYTDSTSWFSSSIDSYEFSTTVIVSDVPVDRVGDILGMSIGSGVNSLQSVDYYSSAYDETYNEALREAITMAKTKADTIAEATGCELDGAPSVQEMSDSYSGRYKTQATNALYDEVAEYDEMYVAPGELEVDANVTVTYHLKAADGDMALSEVSEDVVVSTDAITED